MRFVYCFVCFGMLTAFIYADECYGQSSSSTADDYIKIPKDFKQYDSRNLSGYLKPLFTTIEQSLNTNMFCRSVYKKTWQFGIDISALGTFIPDAQKSFDLRLPDSYAEYDRVQVTELRNGAIRTNFGLKTSQPTIYGGYATPVFANATVHNTSHKFIVNGVARYVDDTTLYKTLGFAEGNGINFMSGLPAVQLMLATPLQSELRLRFLYAPIENAGISYFGFIYNQQFNHWFKFFQDDPLMGAALNLAYHTINRNPGISIKSYAVGVNFSKSWDYGLTVYSGLQYEDMTGTIEFHKKIEEGKDPNAEVDSPYEEIRYGYPLNISVETFTNFRLTAGMAYRWKGVEIHGDFALASQPSVAAGVSYWIDFGSSDSDNPYKDKRDKRRKGR